MGVIKQERDCLDRVLRRYVATGTVDAALAEAEGGWAAVTGHPGRPCRRRRGSNGTAAASSPRCRSGAGGEVLSNGRRRPAVRRPVPSGPTPRPVPRRARALGGADRGPVDGRPDHLRRGRGDRRDRGRGARRRACSRASAARAHLEIEVDAPALRQRPLRRRAAAAHRRPAPSRRRPRPARAARAVGAADRYHVDGEVTFHGVDPAPPGHGRASPARPRGKLVVSGEQVFDIRDFDIASPTVLMLRIYPDVLVQLQVEAEPMDSGRSRSDGDPAGLRRGLRARRPRRQPGLRRRRARRSRRSASPRSSTTCSRSLRSHAAHSLRELASHARAGRTPTVAGLSSSVSTQDLVERVKSLVGRE